MFGVLVLLGVYAYCKPCLSKHDDKMLTISQGSTFVVLLTIMMAKNSEGMPEVAITLLLYLSTFVPLAACFYIVGSEVAQYREQQLVNKQLRALMERHAADQGNTQGAAGTGQGAMAGVQNARIPRARKQAIPAKPLR